MKMAVLAMALALIGASARADVAAPADRRIEVIAQVLPTVVSIRTKALGDTSKPMDASALRSREAFASGFIISPDGLIATNRHVVENAFDILVVLGDGTRLSAHVVGKGRRYDLALLKVDAGRPLPAARFGDSDKLGLGDAVIAIGNPFGLGISVSSGIVSALDRDLGTTQFDRFIQTDAAINHGNSGGPLFNLAGEVIGIDTALYTVGKSDQGGSVGIGFAIPSTDARQFLELMQRTGYIRAGSLECIVQPVAQAVADALGIAPRGVIVAEVLASGPAAGLIEPGDIILTLDGAPVASPVAYYRQVGARLGEPIAITLWRRGAMRTVTVTAVQWAQEAPSTAIVADRPAMKSERVMGSGLTLAPLTADSREIYHIAPSIQGLVVTNVAADTVGATAGFSAGDVIEQIQMEPVRTLAVHDDVLEALRRGGVRAAVVLVRGSGGARFVTVPLDGWRH